MKRRSLVGLAAALTVLSLPLHARPSAAAAPVADRALDPQACDANYWPCIPPPPPDLDCGDIKQRVWRIGPSDPHALDRDGDGIGCESYPVGPAGPPGGVPQPTTVSPQPTTVPPQPVLPPPPPAPPKPACAAGNTAPAATPPPAPAGLYTPIAPVRVLDTRSSTPLAANESRTFTVTGGSIPSDVTMVALNVTADAPTATGYLTLYSGGSTPPNASNVNFYAGTTTPNFAMVRVSNGQLTVFNSAGCTQVLIDVVGYVKTGVGSGYTAVTPSRVFDTRDPGNAPMSSNSTRAIMVRGRGGVPVGAQAVALNITAVDPTATGYLTVFASGTATPTASNLNFTAGTTVANLVIVKLSDSGQVSVYNSSGTTGVLIDVLGYYAAAGDSYVAVTPARLLDVRQATSFSNDETRELQVAGQGGVPSNATAVAVNVTAVDPTENSFLTVFPAGVTEPGVSSVNFRSTRTIANLVIVKLSSGGRVSIHNAAGSTGVLVDVVGYFTSAAQTTALTRLTIASPHTATPYLRAAFGDDWIDADHDCHDARAEVLMDETTLPVTFNPNGCTVATGRWTDPWGGYTSMSAADFQIDHTVPLADAWRSGAWAWTDAERLAFANDVDFPDHLNALLGSLNTTKGDKTPDAWKPPLTSSWCRYARSWAEIKAVWSLTVTQSEYNALASMLATC